MTGVLLYFKHSAMLLNGSVIFALIIKVRSSLSIIEFRKPANEKMKIAFSNLRLAKKKKKKEKRKRKGKLTSNLSNLYIFKSRIAIRQLFFTFFFFH